MKRPFRSASRLAALLLVGLALTSCNDNSSSVTPETIVDKSAVKSSDDPNDQAFDKEMSRILGEMQKMVDSMSMTGDPDMDFAMMMSMHHQLGIEVGNAVIQYGKHDEAKAIARKANEGNSSSKARLQAYLAQHPTPEKIDANVYAQFMEEMKTGMRTMNQSFGLVPNTADVDVDFARKLTVHHEGAINMANGVLQYASDQAIKDESEKIINDQASELKELARFVNQHGVPTSVN